MIYCHALLSSTYVWVFHWVTQKRASVFNHSISYIFYWDAHRCYVLLFGFYTLGVVFVDLLHELDLLFLHFWQFSPYSVFLLAQLHNSLSLLSVDSCQFLLPILHIFVLGSLRFFCYFSSSLLLARQVILLHFFYSAIVLIRLLLEFPGIIKFDQIYGFLDILKFLFMSESDFLVSSTQFVDSFNLFGIVFVFLDRKGGTHWLILLTSTFFWMASLVSCLFFLTASFSFWSCWRSSSTLFCIACICSLCLLT